MITIRLNRAGFTVTVPAIFFEALVDLRSGALQGAAALIQ
jgi:hypothetical protein